MAGKGTRILALVTSLSPCLGCPSQPAGTDGQDGAAPARSRAPYEETRETIDALAEDLMWSNRITGLSLALVDGQRVVWAKGWGQADADAHLAATPRTVYDVGSVTKVVTATAVLLAVERGELELDDTLAELLPELDLAGDAEERITLEDLLTHQSGLPSDWFVHSLSEDPPPWPEIVEEIRGLELAAPPRTLTLYSNLGMTLAGAALARATGEPYEDWVTTELLRPAGMRTAHFVAGPEPEPVLLPMSGGPRGLAAIERAAAYRQNEARLNPQFRLVPAGGMRASVLDLAALARLMLGEGRIDGRQLLPPEQVAAMLEAHNRDLAIDVDHRFGYAWMLDMPEFDWLGAVAHHAGRTYYHHAILVILPEQGLAVAVASNSLSAGKSLETLAIQTLISAVQEKRGLEPPAPRPHASDATPELPLAELEEFLARHRGDYATSIGVSTIEQHAGGIWSRARVGSSELHPLDLDSATFDFLADAVTRFADIPLDLGPGRDGDRHILLIDRDGRLRRAGVRLPAPAPISAAWRARVGRWELVPRAAEVSTIAEPSLAIVDGRLRFEFTGLLEQPPMPVVMALEPLDDRRARIQGLARGQGTIIEVRGEGADEHLWWTGRELRRVSF
ncbi:MAG: beta-lactamase family protein [Myxococcales bacterium]|nr:beta-lactamase family protein [Myxococcales bacterium]